MVFQNFWNNFQRTDWNFCPMDNFKSIFCLPIFYVYFLLVYILTFQVLISFMWIYSIVLTTAYSSNLTAFLSIQQFTKPIDTIEELAESTITVRGFGPFFQQQLAGAEDKNLKVYTDVIHALKDEINFSQFFTDFEHSIFKHWWYI